MKRSDDLYRKLNNLLSMLRQSFAVERVNEYYMKFDNPAPAELLQEYIAQLQEELDNAT
jgi:hypothetical protein